MNGDPVHEVAGRAPADVGHPHRVHWLLGELAILLEFSDVGLYEFMWILRTDFPGRSGHEYRADAAAALGHLLERGARLLWRRKGSIRPIVDHSIPRPSNADWDDPQLGSVYLAVTGQIALAES